MFSTLLIGQTNSIEIGLESGGSQISLRGNEFIDDFDSDFGFVTGVS